MHQIRFSLGLCPDPAGELTSLLLLRGGKGKGRGEEGKDEGRGEEWDRGREEEGGVPEKCKA